MFSIILSLILSGCVTPSEVKPGYPDTADTGYIGSATEDIYCPLDNYDSGGRYVIAKEFPSRPVYYQLLVCEVMRDDAEDSYDDEYVGEIWCSEPADYDDVNLTEENQLIVAGAACDRYDHIELSYTL